MPEAGPGRTRGEVVIGIDYGDRRIGLATGNTLTGTARPLTTLGNRGALDERLGEIVAEWRPRRLIVGLPLTPDGGDSALTGRARAFAARLAADFPDLQVCLHDERYTSRQAEAQFAEARRAGRARRGQAGALDGVAAALIVESWLAELPRDAVK